MLILKIVISVIALFLLAGHLMWPQLTIDAISLGFLIVALLPWASTLIESAKFPGGWEIKFRDLKSASDKIASEETILLEKEAAPVSEAVEVIGAQDWLRYVRPVAETDANLALVALRIEIEKRLRVLAEKYQFHEMMPLTRLFRGLQRREVLSGPIFSSLEEIVQSGNRAAHGASVEPSVQQWALESGPRILSALDAAIAKSEG